MVYTVSAFSSGLYPALCIYPLSCNFFQWALFAVFFDLHEIQDLERPPTRSGVHRKKHMHLLRKYFL